MAIGQTMRKRLKVQIPEKLEFLISEKSRYKVSYGGRGAAKTRTYATALIIKAYTEGCRILCTREQQNSIKDSVHRVLSDTIKRMGLTNAFTITDTEIRCNHNDGLFIFRGLKQNFDEIKSIEDIKYCWVEEAHKVSDESLNVLIPTIRSEDSEIWFSFNTGSKLDPVYRRFVATKHPDAIVVKVNYYDNPWFPEVLRKEMEYDKTNNPERYKHVWLGEPRRDSENAFLDTDSIDSAIKRDVTPSGRVVFGVDCARFGDDKTVIAKRWGLHVHPLERMEKTDEIDTAQFVLDEVRRFRDETGYQDVIEIRIDVTGGYGAGAYDILKRNLADNINMVPVSFAAAGNDQYKNAASIMWGDLRALLPQMHLPDDPQLMLELGRRTFNWVNHDGMEKVLIQPKSEYKSEYNESPDSADALVLCCTSNGILKLVIHGFDVQKVTVKNFSFNFNKISLNSTLYVTTWLEKNMLLSVLAVVWNSERGDMHVLADSVYDNPRPELTIPEFTRRIKAISKGQVSNLNNWTWVGNKRLSNDKMGNIADVYRKYGIAIREPLRFEENGAILHLQRLVERNRLFFHPTTAAESALQVSEWTVKDGRPQGDGYGMAWALCQIASHIVESGRTKPEIPRFKEYTERHTRFQEYINQKAQEDRLHEVSVDSWESGDKYGGNGWMI